MSAPAPMAVPAALPLRARAPAKINLGLFVGPVRAADGRHELASVMQSISLADTLTLEIAPDATAADGVLDGAGTGGHDGDDGTWNAGGAPAGGTGEDRIVCPGVSGAPQDNLAAAALRLFREATGWDAPPLRLSIRKQIPVAAGLGGGSADAAATLRLARRASGGLGSEELMLELATRLGADVPAQLAPGRWLATGAGERLRELPPPTHPFGVLVLPVAATLATAAVYARADDLGVPRDARAVRELAGRLAVAFELGAPAPAFSAFASTSASSTHELLHNDLQAPAISLCPPIAPALAEALDAGADAAFVSGSGPTVVGLFLRANGPGRAERAAAGLAGRAPAAICATSTDSGFARVE